MRRSSPNRLALVGLLGLFLLSGCSKKNFPPLVPVNGRILYKGQPVAGLTVNFLPTATKDREGRRLPSSIGVTGKDGTFTLASGHGAGAVIGMHKVTLSSYPLPPQQIPPELFQIYEEAATTRLSVDVPEGGLSSKDFELDQK